MEYKDIKILEELDKIYYLLDIACGNFIIENKERDRMQKAICYIQEKYKQDKKVINEMAKVMCKFDCIPSKVTNYKDLIDYFRKKCE